ncbi:MAG TPA: carboxypeptidase-like regulatory domain-containing protein, partial [Bryobacteraceae bacterium]|nr:carboxypeptidase-like regulatory domain-containing protein [Bryobacteraceae bacterium]
MKANFTQVLLGMFLCLLVVGTAWSQGPTAAINGQLIDPSGAAIAGATVTARDLDRGTSWPTQSNEAGFYSLPRLPVGNYEIKVEAKGFQTALQRSVTLVIDQNAK